MTPAGTRRRVLRTEPAPSCGNAIALVIYASSENDADLATLAIDGGDELATLIDDDAIIVEPSLSPNGQWLVYYRAGESGGAAEINIRPYPDVRQQRRPVVAGLNPVFSADGSELFLYDGGGLSAIPIEYAPFRIGTPQRLFRGQYWYGVAGPTGRLGRAWDVDPNNDRFLMITLPGSDGPDGEPLARPRINVVLNWFEELRERVPVP